MLEEFRKYRACGIVFFIMNLALSLIIFFMVYWNRTFSVSMLTLESTMLTTFSDGTMSMTGRRILLGVSGGVISVCAHCIITMRLDCCVLPLLIDIQVIDFMMNNPFFGCKNLTTENLKHTKQKYRNDGVKLTHIRNMLKEQRVILKINGIVLSQRCMLPMIDLKIISTNTDRALLRLSVRQSPFTVKNSNE